MEDIENLFGFYVGWSVNYLKGDDGVWTGFIEIEQTHATESMRVWEPPLKARMSLSGNDFWILNERLHANFNAYMESIGGDLRNDIDSPFLVRDDEEDADYIHL